MLVAGIQRILRIASAAAGECTAYQCQHQGTAYTCSHTFLLDWLMMEKEEPDGLQEGQMRHDNFYCALVLRCRFGVTRSIHKFQTAPFRWALRNPRPRPASFKVWQS
jgi:hypothetical protein